MKRRILFLTMIISMNSYAEMHKEFDETTERKCHEEVRTLGCVKGDEESQSCTEMKKKSLSAECKALHETRKPKQ